MVASGGIETPVVPASKMTQVTFLNKTGRVDVLCEPGESLLQAGLRHGLELPYACGAGVCGTCVARSKPNTVENLWPDAPGAAQLNAGKGECLLCQGAALRDCEILVPAKIDLSRLSDQRPARFEANLQDVKVVAPDVATFTLRLPETVRPISGQYFLMRPKGMQGFRAYSMTNFDESTDALHFVIKKVAGGVFSEKIFSGEPLVESLEAFGPMGLATFDPSDTRDLICLVGGSGIAVIMSILAQAQRVDHFSRHRLFMVFGARRIEEFFFLDELADLARTHPDHIQIHLAVSEGEAAGDSSKDVRGLSVHHGFVHDVAKNLSQPGEFDGGLAFLGGPPPMLNSCLALLLDAGVPVSDIRYDRFA